MENGVDHGPANVTGNRVLAPAVTPPALAIAPAGPAHAVTPSALAMAVPGPVYSDGRRYDTAFNPQYCPATVPESTANTIAATSNVARNALATHTYMCLIFISAPDSCKFTFGHLRRCACRRRHPATHAGAPMPLIPWLMPPNEGVLPVVKEGVLAPLPIDTPGARTLAKPDGVPAPLPRDTPGRADIGKACGRRAMSLRPVGRVPAPLPIDTPGARALAKPTAGRPTDGRHARRASAGDARWLGELPRPALCTDVSQADAPYAWLREPAARPMPWAMPAAPIPRPPCNLAERPGAEVTVMDREVPAEARPVEERHEAAAEEERVEPDEAREEDRERLQERHEDGRQDRYGCAKMIGSTSG